jgi:hypothetical protein
MKDLHVIVPYFGQTDTIRASIERDGWFLPKTGHEYLCATEVAPDTLLDEAAAIALSYAAEVDDETEWIHAQFMVYVFATKDYKNQSGVLITVSDEAPKWSYGLSLEEWDHS